MPERTEAIVPRLGTISASTVDCTQAWTPPAELTGPDGLARFGWTLDDLRLRLAWNVPNRFANRWISSNDDAVPSVRVRPWLAPAAGTCFESGLKALQPRMASGQPCLGDFFLHASAFAHRETGLDAMRLDGYASPDYDLSGGNALLRALKGLSELPNLVPDGPPPFAWSDAEDANVRAAASHYPPAVQQALAKLVLAIGEAQWLKQMAFGDADVETLERIHNQFRAEFYGTLQSTFASPSGGTVIPDILAEADKVDPSAFIAAAQALGRASDEVRLALQETGPIDAPDLRVVTSSGGILIRTRDSDDVYARQDLDGMALVVDVAGDDTWGPGVASPTFFWMGASVVLDLAGNDRYGPDTPDLESGDSTAAQVFANEHGFSQGSGLFGVGLLIDAAGDDTYRASVYSQGSGAFGVGALVDLGGTDSYRLGHMGQGAGFFGLGALIDVEGNDSYRLYAVGQGAGKTGGEGVLFDADGDDEYLAYNVEHGPELPGSGVPNYFKLDPSWAYNDGTQAHYMSIAQGVGWGYRQEWVKPNENWMGGFGALVDLGAGKDRHTADTFSMGQGFVYGFGFLYDDGGDDRYRSFWWGPAASAHMGSALFIDEGGNDDLYVTRASAGFGFDCSVSWLLDHGGNDTYGGQMHYGESYNYGLTFFVNEGGDDTYNAGGALANPIYGGVRTGLQGAKLVGAFLDLGGGNDTYVNAPAEVGNDRTWNLPPVNPLPMESLDPDHHKGVGIDQ